MAAQPERWPEPGDKMSGMDVIAFTPQHDASEGYNASGVVLLAAPTSKDDFAVGIECQYESRGDCWYWSQGYYDLGTDRAIALYKSYGGVLSPYAEGKIRALCQGSDHET